MTLFGQPRPRVREAARPNPGVSMPEVGPRSRGVGGSPENPTHYTRLKALTGVETWDILDFVAGDDPDMWNLGKYWFRMGHKEGQSTLTEKKKMLKYLERSIAKEEAAK